MKTKILILLFIIVASNIPMVATAQLAESFHPYANNFVNSWPAITEPGATEMRLHFSKLELSDDGDVLTILDKDGNKLVGYSGYGGGFSIQDSWTEWFTGDTMKVRFETNGNGNAYGFLIDQKQTRTSMAPSSALPESFHPYANNFVNSWPAITEPGATEMRLHFSKLELSDDGDVLTILDKDGNKLVGYSGYGGGFSIQDSWTEWFTGDTMKVRFETNRNGNAYGFLIDNIATRAGTPTIPTYAIPSTPMPTSTSKPTIAPTYSTQTTTSTPTFTPTKTSTPTSTPSEPDSSAVLLHGEKTDVVLGEDILLKLSAVNLITKPPMSVQVMIYPPSGMSVTGSDFVESGAGIYSTTYALDPGKGKDIEVHIKSNQVGDFNVKGRIVYYFGEEKGKAEDHTLNLPIKVRTEAAPQQGQMQAPNSNPSTPGFEAIIGILGILLVSFLRKRW